MLQEQVLPELDAGFEHANTLTVSQQERVAISQSEPIADVVANDRAKCSYCNYHPNIEAGLRRGINRSEDEDRLTGQRQSHTFQAHDESDHPIAMHTHKLLQF